MPIKQLFQILTSSNLESSSEKINEIGGSWLADSSGAWATAEEESEKKCAGVCN